MMHLALVIFGLVLPAVTHGHSRKAIEHLQWEDCGSENATVNLLTLDVYPVPVEIPGEIHINGVNIQSTSPLNNVTVQLEIESKIFVGYIPMPCIFNIGSCSYEVCSIIQSYADKENDIPDLIYNAIHFIDADDNDDVDFNNTTDSLHPPTHTSEIAAPISTEDPTSHQTEATAAVTLGQTATPEVITEKTTTEAVITRQTTPAVIMPETTSTATVDETTPAAVAMEKTTTFPVILENMSSAAVTLGKTNSASAIVDETTSTAAVTIAEKTSVKATIGNATTATAKATTSAPTSQQTTTPRPTSPPTTTPTILPTTIPTTRRPQLHLSCPLQPLSFNLDSPYTFKIKKLPTLLEIFAEGEYRIKAQLLSEEREELGCFKFNVTIKKHKEPGSSGWFFRKRRQA